MTEEEEIISGAEEEEEQETWEDNTLNRDDIINATAHYIDNLEITTPDIDEIDWDDEKQLTDQIPVTIDATKLIYKY